MSSLQSRPVRSSAILDYTPTSEMSLRDLRTQMVQRAVNIAAKGRSCRARGDVVRARDLELRAAELMRVARSVNVN